MDTWHGGGYTRTGLRWIHRWMDGLGTSLSACLVSVSPSLVLSLSVHGTLSLSVCMWLCGPFIHTHHSLTPSRVPAVRLSACVPYTYLASVHSYLHGAVRMCVCIGAAALLSSRSSSFVVKGMTACLPARPPITECKSGGRERANELRHTDRSVGRSGLT